MTQRGWILTLDLTFLVASPGEVDILGFMEASQQLHLITSDYIRHCDEKVDLSIRLTGGK